MFNLWANTEGDIAEMGDWGFFRGTGGFKMVEVAKVFNNLENFIILFYLTLNYYIFRFI